MQEYKGWKEFFEKDIDKKLSFFQKNGNVFDVIYSQQFTITILERLFKLSDKIRTIAKSKKGTDFLQTILSDKRAMLFFSQPSTRTFLSFLNACHILGIKVSEIRDSRTSSEIKGESLEDSIRTFSSYVDLIIIRHFNENFAEKASWLLNSYTNRSIPVINGGSGKDQHPTQALLDMYTIYRSAKTKGGIDNKKVIMVGDLKRGRTIRSLSRLLALYKNIEIIFVAPKKFQVKDDITKFLDSNNVKYNKTENLEEVLGIGDILYFTRLQNEYDIGNESEDIDYSKYYFTEKHLNMIKKDAIIMHPFPRRNEISFTVDNDPRALYWKQSRNGMWIRAALIIYLFQREDLAMNFQS